MADIADLLAQAELLGLNLAFDTNYSTINDTSHSSNGSGVIGETVSSSLKFKHDVLRYYLLGIGGMTLCALGIIGNILSVIILTRSVMRSSTYSYLTALALSDTFFLFFSLLILSKDSKKPQRIISWDDEWYVYLFPYVHPACVTCQLTSIWLTLAFTVDRYIMICHPFQAEGMCSVSRARKVIIALCIGGVFFNIPRFFEYHTVTPIVTTENRTQPVIDLTDIAKTSEYRTIIHSWLYFFFVAGVPFLTLLVLNIFLIIAVHNSRKKGKQINAKEKHRNNTTIMLISVVVIFLFCQGPALISRMVWAFENSLAISQWPWIVFGEVSNFLVIVNSAVNIVPYYFFGRKFRRQFWRLFCRCLLTKEEIRKLARSLSISVDQRRLSNVSKMNNQELQNFHNLNHKKFKNSIAVPLLNSADQNRLSVDETSKGNDKSSIKSSPGSEQRNLTVKFEANGNCQSRVDDTVSCVNCHNNSLL